MAQRSKNSTIRRYYASKEGKRHARLFLVALANYCKSHNVDYEIMKAHLLNELNREGVRPLGRSDN